MKEACMTCPDNRCYSPEEIDITKSLQKASNNGKSRHQPSTVFIPSYVYPANDLEHQPGNITSSFTSIGIELGKEASQIH
jgi:hypothetical protein